MHKGVILLVKAGSADEARANAEKFLEGYEGSIWDWYQIGGRWQGLLTGYEPDKDHAKKGKWPTQYGEYEGDILPLKDCLAKVVEYKGDATKIEAKHQENIDKYRTEGNHSMMGYCMKELGEFLGEDFCFEANVFNTNSFTYAIPEDTEGFWAVVVDMHN